MRLAVLLALGLFCFCGGMSAARVPALPAPPPALAHHAAHAAFPHLLHDLAHVHVAHLLHHVHHVAGAAHLREHARVHAAAQLLHHRVRVARHVARHGLVAALHEARLAHLGDHLLELLVAHEEHVDHLDGGPGPLRDAAHARRVQALLLPREAAVELVKSGQFDDPLLAPLKSAVLDRFAELMDLPRSG